MMELQVIWFILVTVLFTGFFFLEGFDYGVGTLLPFLSDKDEERSMVIRTIGPVWDGNEVWMITAGGALFAAFPHVYATMFSTFYFALFLMLLALILRGVAFELRTKHECACWRRSWDAAICFGSAIPAFLWGVAVTNLAQGLPINGNMHYTGSFFDLLSVYTIIGGLAFFFVFAFHGAAFLTIRLAHTGLIYRIRETALKLGACAAAAFVACLLLTGSNTDILKSPVALAALLGAAVLFLGAVKSIRDEKFRASFTLSSLAVVCTTVGFFAGLFPRLMVSSLMPEWSLTIYNASSSELTLQIMTVAALCLVPVVLIYQGWTYWIFRKRVTEEDVRQGHD